ncbi:MAG TPA: hypothetical protein VMW41_00280 [Candidatus Bathyarchaeia archaeon]|nr:hypothetical protein [Candidatus Bathyarchaeia archaeon]
MFDGWVGSRSFVFIGDGNCDDWQSTCDRLRELTEQGYAFSLYVQNQTGTANIVECVSKYYSPLEPPPGPDDVVEDLRDLQPDVSVSLSAEPDPVAAGEVLTYTVGLTNTGGVTDTFHITLTLPAQVNPTGSRTWTITDLPPTATWQTLVTAAVVPEFVGQTTANLRADGRKDSWDEISVTTTVRTCIPVEQIRVIKENQVIPIAVLQEFPPPWWKYFLRAEITPTTASPYFLTWTPVPSATYGDGHRVFYVAHLYPGDLFSVSVTAVNTCSQVTAIYSEVVPPVLEITKSAPPTVAWGASIQYSLAVTINNEYGAGCLYVRDILPEGLVFQGCDACTYDGATREVGWDWHGLNPEHSHVFQISSRAVHQGVVVNKVYSATFVLHYVRPGEQQTFIATGGPVTTTVLPPMTQIFLPVSFRNYTLPLTVEAPDLVVQNVVIATNDIYITVANVGTERVGPGTFVHLYVDPNPIPTVNQRWWDIGSQGAFWIMANSLEPKGLSVTLHFWDPSYQPGELYSHVDFPLASGTKIYVQVDAWWWEGTHGRWLESNENNNVYGPVYAP